MTANDSKRSYYLIIFSTYDLSIVFVLFFVITIDNCQLSYYLNLLTFIHNLQLIKRI